jgi:predicted alpha/beta superfamily hydrolase
MKILFAVLLLTFSFALSFAQTGDQTKKPFVLGEIRELQSAELGEKRILNIYLPAGYEQDSEARYPVIYLLDGSADEDFIHIVGLVQFNNFPWIDRVPKSIVVGIANVDRRRDFTFPTSIAEDRKSFPTAGRSERFIRFLENELQPFIEKNYRTSNARMLIGQSLGGLLATEILLKKPRLFDKYIIISPSLWWDDGSLLDQKSEIFEQGFSPKTDIYIGVGKEGLTPGRRPRVMEVDANLLADRLRKTKSPNVRVYFDYLPEEDHATITHSAVFNAFRLLYPAKTEKD